MWLLTVIYEIGRVNEATYGWKNRVPSLRGNWLRAGTAMAIRHNLIASSSYLSVYYPLRHLLISIIIPFVIPIRTASFRLTVRNKSSPFIVDLFLSPSSMLVYIHIHIHIHTYIYTDNIRGTSMEVRLKRQNKRRNLTRKNLVN